MTDRHPHGYCWDEHPQGGARCTLSLGHGGAHLDWYADPDRREWTTVQPPAETPRPA